MDRVKAEQTADNILRICLGLCVLLFICVFVKVFCIKGPEPAQVVSDETESRDASTVSENVEVADLQRARLDYYRSQARYYTLLSIDYEALLEGRGLLEVEE